MIGLTRDIAKLIKLLRASGPRRAMGTALLAARARLMRISDRAWESSVGLTIDESDVPLDSLRINSQNKQHGFSYVPCSRFMVRALLNYIDVDFRRFCFVDFGSGEGRSLIAASLHQFDEILGVEFAEELHQAAIRNIAKVNLAAAQAGKIRSLHMDAVQFEIPRRDCVLYFYNPFGEAVLEQVLRNIERAHRECHAKYYVIFYQTSARLEVDNTRNAELLREAPFLVERAVRFPNFWTRFLLGSQDHYLFETRDNYEENVAIDPRPVQ